MTTLIRTDVNGLIEYLDETGVKLSRSLIYKLVKQNKIPHKRVGARIIFDIQQIEDWLKESEVS